MKKDEKVVEKKKHWKGIASYGGKESKAPYAWKFH